ncbi:tumor necrosis factor receptor superfamily member 25 [Erinaceus europaeus]|uniref:Tumor necrosis factor receptor superfamily member 25 n=1 Tax=Erinaceus europaeus TaxID=9365 RepID=A0ABM3Y8D8_ERIEU|nr:tumor necrosis factor receptor superfamily member 25 [Erinaceus europaeus]
MLLGSQGLGSTPHPRCDCAHSSQKKNGMFCCRGCPAGHYLKESCTEPCGKNTCAPCSQGTFLAWENHQESKCNRCRACYEQGGQVALRNCSAVSNTLCGCKPGWFKDCWDSGCMDSSEFICLPCVECGMLHRNPQASCPRQPTDCGSCLHGFYEDGNSCVSCPKITLGSCPEPCAAICGWRQMFWVQVLLAGLMVPLLLGATLTYTYHRCQPSRSVVPAEEAGLEVLTPLQDPQLSHMNSPHTLSVPTRSSEKVCTTHLVGNSWAPSFPQTQEAACPDVTWPWDLQSRVLGSSTLPPPSPPSTGPGVSSLQPGPQLYDVMDAVPVRRWKEFVRTLGLREAEIEAVEVEVSRFRDQQYEMLKRWRQQQPAGLGAVYAALERMGLDGCAEDLRSRLQRSV